jgi:peptidyl-prolyl cis-trans isomerase SurA
MRRLRLSLALLALAAIVACRPSPAPAPPPVSPDAWATVGTKTIMRDDVEKAFRRVGNGQPLSDEETLTAQLAVLDDLIVEELLLAKAQTLKIEVPDSEVDTAYANAKQNITDEAFQKELTSRNLTTADMRDGLRRQLLAQKLIEREVGSKVTVSDQQVTDFFNANRAQFNLPEEAFHLAQIVVTPVRESQVANRTGDDASTPQAAAAKVAMLMERLKTGTQFADLARDFSEDPESAPRGGDLGLVPASTVKQAAPALRDAVLQLTPGRARVVTQGGLHTIVFVVAKEPAGQRDLSTPGVRQRITDTLRGRREQLLRAAYLAEARADAQVVNHMARRVVESQGVPPASAATPAK